VKRGGITTELRRGHPLGSLYGVGERQCGVRGGDGGAASSVREGGEGARGLVGRLNLLGHSGPKGQMGRLATGSKVEENFFSGKN
jgi:hypothetical protein